MHDTDYDGPVCNQEIRERLQHISDELCRSAAEFHLSTLGIGGNEDAIEREFQRMKRLREKYS